MFLRVHSQEHGKLEYEDKGLIMEKQYPFIGASPDGQVSCQTCGTILIEIKCPYSMRNFYPKFAAIDKDCAIVNNKMKLKESSDYYVQIQGQLAIAGLILCKLIIYTTKGIQVIDVDFSLTFWSQCRVKLLTFFENYKCFHLNSQSPSLE